jgi:hypothetical protein
MCCFSSYCKAVKFYSSLDIVLSAIGNLLFGCQIEKAGFLKNPEKQLFFFCNMIRYEKLF